MARLPIRLLVLPVLHRLGLEEMKCKRETTGSLGAILPSESADLISEACNLDGFLRCEVDDDAERLDAACL